MRKVPDHVQAAIDECNRLNAKFTWQQGKNNIVAEINFNGKIKKTFLSSTPSDWRAPFKVKQQVRHTIWGMR